MPNGQYEEDIEDGEYFKIVEMTDEALLLTDGFTEDWCPRSLIKEGRMISRKHQGIEMELHIQEWILKEKGWI